MKKFLFLLIPFLLFASQIEWEIDFNIALNRANKEKKPLMVFFESHNCKWCEKMLHTTFKNKQIIKRINDNFIPIKVYNNDKRLPKYIDSKITPTTFFITSKVENIIRPVLGYWDEESFLSFLDDVERRLSNSK